jgi:hypothetical protein
MVRTPTPTASAFADKIVVDEFYCARVSQNIDLVHAAGIPLAVIFFLFLLSSKKIKKKNINNQSLTIKTGDDGSSGS